MAGDIKQRMTMDTRQHTAGVNKAKRSMRNWRDEVGNAGRQMTSFMGAVRTAAGVLASIFVAGAMARAIKSMIEMGDKLGKLSTRLNVAVDDLAALSFVAERSGSRPTS